MPENPLQIVIIEDHIGDFLLIEEALSNHGIPARLQLFQDGENALKQLAQMGAAGLPDLIIVDLNLPRIEGMQLLRYVRGSRLFDQTPVMVFTSSQSAQDRNEAEQIGANAFLTKPSSLDDFLSSVASMVRKLTSGPRPSNSGGHQRLRLCCSRSQDRMRIRRRTPSPMNDGTDRCRCRIPRARSPL
ncbi:MAG: response regulator [Acidobacteriaceae bacterium]|nr:response regulator [Acidobacteriaceae bacterium]MBV9782163.1 response regulator [Acidobacteriaceae bacterium]